MPFILFSLLTLCAFATPEQTFTMPEVQEQEFDSCRELAKSEAATKWNDPRLHAAIQNCLAPVESKDSEVAFQEKTTQL